MRGLMASVGALAIAVVASSCGLGTANSTNRPLSIADAQRIARDYWSVNEQANIARTGAAISKIEAGPALDLDEAVLRGANVAGTPTQTVVRPLLAADVFLVNPSSYPREFLMDLSYHPLDDSGKPKTDVFHFLNVDRQLRDGAPWHVVFYVIPPTAPVVFKVDSPRRLEPVTAGGDLALDPKALAARVASYINGGDATGFATDGYLAQSRKDATPNPDALAYGATITDTRTVRSDWDTEAFRTSDGGAVVLVALDRQSIQKVGAAGCFGAPADPTIRALLKATATERFSSVESKTMEMLEVIDPPAGKGAVRVAGQAFGALNATGQHSPTCS